MEAVYKALNELTSIHPLFKGYIWMIGSEDNSLKFGAKKKSVDTKITPAKLRLINRMLRGSGYYAAPTNSLYKVVLTQHQ